jgi:hypothetical protein
VKAPRLILYPFLAALYPLLALAASNSDELVRPGDLAKPFVIALSAAGVAWLLSRGLTRDTDRRAFLTLVAVGVFSAFGYGVDLLKLQVRSEALASIIVLAPVAVAALMVRRVQVPFRPVTRYLNLVMVILVAWTGGSFLWHSRPPTTPLTLPDIPIRTVALRNTGPGAQPNLFLIVLDKYAGHRSLLKTFGFDNTAFERALQRDGFFVPAAARANYVQTFLALAAMLNWQYLDGVAQQLGPENGSWAVAYPLIEDDRTWRALRRLGYRFVFLPSALPATDHNRFADVQLPDPSQMPHEFGAIWLRGTLLSPILDRVCPRLGCSGPSLPYVPETARLLDWKFEMIPALAESDRPVFVLAHLTVPHEPYLYDAECRHRQPYWPAVDTGREESAVKAAYVAQVQCVNRKVETLVRAIAARSARPSIILLQSDHGHGLFGRDVPPLSEVDPRRVADRTDIFAAYRLPGAPPDLVHDSIGPVNAMRAVMRYYYGFDLPPLPDVSYWSSANRPYDFTRVR